jgi:hypothetical protein
MMNSDVLVVEISGKRPGDKTNRPTEQFKINYDKIIISNNSENYETDWPIINVPKEYEEYYKQKMKNSDNAWYAPMNRSYAIKYAREHGYKYLVQLDDNIVMLQIAYILKDKWCENYSFAKKYRATARSGDGSDMMNDFIKTLVELLKNTNAGIAGCNMSGAAIPGADYLRERYCYSLFALDLNKIPDEYHGDFEDDIEFRLKLNQMNVPSIQNCVLMYGKTGQQLNKDLTGCRAEYLKVGVKRGEHMRKLYGDIYSAGISSRNNRAGKQETNENVYFRHKLKPIKIGVLIKDKEQINKTMADLFKKYAKKKQNQLNIKETTNKEV